MKRVAERAYETYEVEMAGHVKDKLYFEPGPERCGSIIDGVCFEFDNEGGWVIPFSELKAMYLASVKVREKVEEDNTIN